jgi:hypothetical protein
VSRLTSWLCSVLAVLLDGLASHAGHRLLSHCHRCEHAFYGQKADCVNNRPSSVHSLIFFSVRRSIDPDSSWLTLDVTRNGLLFLKRDRQLPGQAD